MCRVKFVIVLLCLIHFVQPRRLYYPNPNDPSAIVFEGPTNYETRKSSENEVEEDILDLINVRHGEIGGPDEITAAPEKVDTGFYFPDD